MTIAIIGAGYVGLPLAIAFSKFKKVFCFDINKSRISELQRGIDRNKQHSKEELSNKLLNFSYQENEIKNKEIYIITVPTPINKNKHPDLSMLKEATQLVGKALKKNSIVIYESTTFPGCTEEVCIPLLEKVSNLKFKKDFTVGYSPERVNPGDKINTLNNITKIISASDNKTLREMKKLYHKICKSTYVADSIIVAESAKVIENTQRDINIAFVNELSVLFNKLKIPTNEVLKAASTKWNFHYYKPGLVGGHCISVDPYYLSYKAKRNKYLPELILSGRRFNENMGKYVVKQIINLLSINNVNLKKAQIGILGFSFKENIPDIRNTKIIQIVKELKKYNIRIKVFDSIVSSRDVNKVYKLKILKFKDLGKFKYDAIVMSVSHDMFKKNISYYNKYYKNKKKKIFIDLKNNYSMYDLKKNKFIFFQL